MKNLTFLIVLFISIAGCDQSQPDFHPDVTDPITGISIQYENNINFPLEKIVSAYIKVEECMGMAAYPGPNIKFIDHIYNYNGFTYYHPPLIIVDASSLLSGNAVILPHEMVHYILLKNGLPDVENSNHNSILFAKCGSVSY